GIDHMLTTGATRTARLSERLGLNDPLAFGQAVAGGGIVAIGLAVWLFFPFIRAFMTKSISDYPADHYVLLQPAPFIPYATHLYRLVFTLFTAVFGLVAARIHRVRSRQSIHGGGGGLAMVVVMFVVSLILCQFPYRIAW